MSYTALDFGTFELSISQVESSSDSIPHLVRNYRCPDFAVLQQLQQSWVFVQGCSHRHMGKVAEVRSPKDGELVVYTESLQQTVQEWVQGYEGCPWSVESTFQQIAGLIEVLAEAQRNKVVHRRLTPEHIYYDSSSGFIKLLDFSPCSLEPDDDRRFVKELPPKYRSPERNTPQWQCSLQSAVKADVYSLGILGFELIYSGVAGEQTTATLLTGLRDYQQLHNLLEQMLREDPRKRPDFLRLQSYLRGELEVPVEKAKVIVRIPSRLPVSHPPPGKVGVLPHINAGSKPSDSKCPNCGKAFKLERDRKQGKCKKCFDAGRGNEESKAHQNEPHQPPPPQPNPLPQSTSEKEISPPDISKNTLKPRVLSAHPISDVAVKPVAQGPAMLYCEKCKKRYDFSPSSSWRLRLCAHRSEGELAEIYKYCSETCVPDVFKIPNTPALNPSLPAVQAPAERLPPANISQTPIPAVISAQLVPIPKAAPIPVASDPCNLASVPARASRNSNPCNETPIGYVPDMQVANEQMQHKQVLCRFCLQPFAIAVAPRKNFEAYSDYCSEECQVRYFNSLGDSSTMSKMLNRKAAENNCMECSAEVASNALVLPCSHKLCSRRCGKKFLDRFFSNFPGGYRDLNFVTCSRCERPISTGITSEWEREEVQPQPSRFPPPAVPVQSVPKAGSVPQTVACIVCGQSGPAKCTSCGHWLCASCEGKSQKSGGGIKCPKCGKDTVVS